MTQNGWHTVHKMDDNFVELGGDVIRSLKIDMGKLYIFKEDSVWKLTKHGIRKIRKPSVNLLLKESHVTE